MNKFPIKLLSFFTGGGFLDMGFEQEGFDICWTNEINPEFSKMFEYGMTMWRKSVNLKAKAAKIFHCGDISRIKHRSIIKSAFPHGKPEMFGIIGGPPCPDFSFAGKNGGGNGHHGKLTRLFSRYVCRLKPSFFIFENVTGLYRIKIHRKFLQGIERHFEKNGYSLDLKILNSLDFGVPQDRERLIMVGVRRPLANRLVQKKIRAGERNWFPWPVHPKFSNAKSRFSWPEKVTRGQKPVLRSSIPKELFVNSVLNGSNPPWKHPNGTDVFKAYSKKFKTVREGDTKRKSFKRLHRYRYSPTVCYGHNEVHLHPWENRRLSVREAMRIQGIPDTYELPLGATLTSKFAVVSNGVPVPLARAVAASMKYFLGGCLQKKNRINLNGSKNETGKQVSIDNSLLPLEV